MEAVKNIKSVVEKIYPELWGGMLDMPPLFYFYDFSSFYFCNYFLQNKGGFVMVKCIGKNIIVAISVLFLAWLIVSYFDVISHNLPGAVDSYQYHPWNIFTMLF